MCSMVIGQTYNSDSIIGKPIKLGKLEVAQNDFPNQMNWNDAKKACAVLGNGWRLPTKDELNLVYLNKDKIGGFAINLYWSSTELGYGDAWYQSFKYGNQDFGNRTNGGSAHCVRAVRSL